MTILSIGIPKEIKDSEGRVGLRPSDIKEMLNKYKNCIYKPNFFVEKDAGAKSGFSNANYYDAGANIVDNVYEKSKLIIKVKEPIGKELKYLEDMNKIFFCYFHFASTNLNYGPATKYPYEELEDNGRLPLLEPMSEIAGTLSVYKGSEILTNEHGKLIGGSTGIAAANVLIIGGGVVGESAAKTAIGLGANVTILDTNLKRIKELNYLFPKSRNLFSNTNTIYNEVSTADLIIGAVHSKGQETAKLINDSHFQFMKSGTIFVDVAIDQGGCTTASIPTTHSNPTYKHNNIIMYCVANMPGLVPNVSTNALCNATSKYLKELIHDEDSLRRYYK